MCKHNDTAIAPLAQLFPSLTLNGGAYKVQCAGLDMGDYLVSGNGEAEVVTVHQDYHRATFYGCTCSQDTFYTPTANNAACRHIGLVFLFISIRVEVLAGDLGRAVLRARRLTDKLIDKKVPMAVVDQACERSGELQFWYNQRRAATVRLIPRRITEALEAADAASTLAGDALVGGDADDLSDMAALFAPHPCRCGVLISAEASACFDCDPGQYESDRQFDQPRAGRQPMPAAFDALVVELWGGAPVAAGKVA